MQEFIDSLNLKFKGKMVNNQYIIIVNSSNDFSSLFNSISLNNFLSLEDNSIATDDESMFRFTNGEYDVILKANYNDDVYSLTIEEK